MRRTQLYLDDHLWSALHTQAKSRKTSVSELVREAMRDRYLAKSDVQAKAMQEFVGIRRNRSEPADAVKYIRSLRRGDRLERLNGK
jgi:predicted DNA-binding ribbon-helix-helix protein